MVPSGRTKTSRKRKRTRAKPARSSHCKKQHQESRKQESSKKRDMDFTDVATCSTPKGQKFRIPQLSTCPPAPKKPRMLSNCSLRRSPLAFFAPPDLDIFFCLALQDLPVSFLF
ncbi:hypothetical protein VNO80_05238 [Phaseolus coccineus]|uniref:Uncharacterized protein n=1 Tax=Phaseolus coccineus TaxID=3886 RepID=A0AAN9NJF9_PHACN